MKRKLTALCLLLCLILTALPCGAAKKGKQTGRVLFVPHDNRPISNEQTAEAIRQLGWEILVPPDELLGDRNNPGNPDKVWTWLEQNAKKTDIAVLSSDTLVYGSLVASRKHNYTEAQLAERLRRFETFKSANPKLHTYVFGSIMRTPRSGEHSGTEEPSYYRSYGADIFRYTALTDKSEREKLNRREKKEYDFLTRLIPKQALDDWLSRRKKNLTVNQRLIDLTRNQTIEYLALGRDDSAPYSQTKMESRSLTAYGKDLGATRFQAMAGIDEFAMLMLTRAVNAKTGNVPFVHVAYNTGRGANTVPAYSDESIADTIHEHILATGGLLVDTPGKADLLLLVNTNPNGKTYEANDRGNNSVPREGTKFFADMVANAVKSGKAVCVADIAYANGADNAMMKMLRDQDLLFRLRAYAGWNTPTNSTGFVLGEGMLSLQMQDAAVDKLLLQRYLDDWAYQSNVRITIGRQLGWLRGTGAYSSLGDKQGAVCDRATRMMQRFAEENLPPLENFANLQVEFPWNRMFEARIGFRAPVSLLHRSTATE